MLINISNHPKSTWSAEQLEKAQQLYGEVVDYPFPLVDPSWSIEEVIGLANALYADITQKYPNKHTYLHIMGEHSLVYHLVSMFEQNGYTCVLSTTDRTVEVLPNGSKKVHFDFVRFRKYK